MKTPSVAITGVGAVSCIGLSLAEIWQSTLAKRNGIREGLGRVSDEVLTTFPENRRENRALIFCVKAAREAMAQAGWSDLGPEDGLILATTTGQLLMWDFAFIDLINDRMDRSTFREKFVHQPLGQLAANFSSVLHHTGPTSLLTSACSASTQALGLGSMWLRQGRVKRCMVVGVEVLCDLTTEGFRSLQLLSVETAQPFDVARKGINLSEGAAAICLEADGSKPLSYISGFGFSTDGYHMTGPHPEGEGSGRAMQSAMQVAGLSPRQIDWVHAHGTGSQQNDLSEGAAISSLFGTNGPWVSSTKWLHGHALAASGAIETALIVHAIGQQTVLCTRGLQTPDPRIDVRHPPHDLHHPLKHVLKNTLGFGGTNAAVIISAPTTEERV